MVSLVARSRNIKPGFFKNYDLADAGPQVQLLFAGLWCLADREGRLEDKPRLIKAELFPYYEFDVNGGLTVLERLSFICRYTVDGMAIIQVLNFKKHQSPHNTEKSSVLPSMEFADKENNSKTNGYIDNGEPTVISPLNNDGNRPDSLIPDSLIHRLTDSPIAEKKAVAAAPCLPEETEKKIADPEKPKPEKAKTEMEMLKQSGIDSQLAKDFLKIRKAKRAPLTETALNGICREALLAGISPEDAIRICTERNWQTFNSTWDWQPKQSQPKSKHTGKQLAQRPDYGEYEPLDEGFNNMPLIDGERVN